MSTSKNLRNRKDVENSDIPEIIERAERLSHQHVTARERERERSSINDVKLVGRDLSIPDKFIEQAISELYEDRRNKIQSDKEVLEERQTMQRDLRTGLSKTIRVVAVIVGLILTVRSIQWLWFASDFTPDEVSPPEPQVIVEERIIKETVLKTVKTVVEEPVVISKPASKTKKKAKTSDTVAQTKAKIVSSSAQVPVQSSPEQRANKTPVVPIFKEADAIVETDKPTVVTENNLEKNEAKKPVVEVVEPKVQVPTEESEKSLPLLAKKIDGEWVLDAYLLYEKGVTLPMEVPVVYEPLELPKTWRFTSGKYKRVMDTNLSFTARFEVKTLPSSFKPVVDEKGEWGQIVASNVVSTIPGIRRQNDYFAVLVGKDTLTIWYLGPNAYRKKLPSQAERYIKK